MPIPWLVVLQSVPWSEIIKNASKVAEGAKKLWSSVSNKSAVKTMAKDVEQPSHLTDSATIMQLQSRLADMELATAELHSQMLASSELIKSLAEQNGELIASIELNRRRMLWLALATLIFGMIAAVNLFVVFAR